MLSAWLTLGLTAAIEVSVRVEAGTPCLELRRLETLLTAQGLTVRDGANVAIRARGEGSASLRLEGTRGSDQLTRKVPAKQGQCPAVERVVVSLILSWAQPMTWAVPRAPSPADPPRPDPPEATPLPARLSPHPDPLPAREREAVDVPLPEATPQVAPVEDAGAPALEELPQPEAPPQIEPPDAGSPSSWSGDLSVLGGAAVGPTPDVTPGGTLRVGVSNGRFGAVIDAALEAERSKAVAPGVAYLRRQWLGLSARVHFLPLERLLLDLTLGVRGSRLDLGGRDYPDARSVVRFDFGGALTAGARLRLLGPLWLEGRAVVALQTSSHALQLQDVASDQLMTLLTIAPWDVGLYLGLGGRL